MFVCFVDNGASARTGAPVRSKAFEAGGMVGSSYGIDKFSLMGGGNVSYALTEIPGTVKSKVEGTGRPVTSTFQIPLSDFHAAIQYRFPLKESPTIPYAVLGFGVLKSFDGTVTAMVTTPIETVMLTRRHIGATDFTVNFDGGIRFDVGPRLGFRAGAKAYKPTENSQSFWGR
jgi:hypothetical protein